MRRRRWIRSGVCNTQHGCAICVDDYIQHRYLRSQQHYLGLGWVYLWPDQRKASRVTVHGGQFLQRELHMDSGETPLLPYLSLVANSVSVSVAELRCSKICYRFGFICRLLVGHGGGSMDYETVAHAKEPSHESRGQRHGSVRLLTLSRINPRVAVVCRGTVYRSAPPQSNC